METGITLNRINFNKQYPNLIHAWVLRDNFEEPVRKFIFGKGEKPTLSNLLENYISLYNHSLPENRTYLTIGVCYALLSTEGNYVNGVPIYPEIDRNINSNWGFDKIVTEIKSKIN